MAAVHVREDRVSLDAELDDLRREVELWNWLTFLLFVGLITFEWLLRKFANLT